MKLQSGRKAVVVLAVLAGVSLAAFRLHRERPDTRPRPAPVAALGEQVVTSRANLAKASADFEARLKADPSDGAAAVALAQVLLRRARVEANGGYTARAQRALEGVLEHEPADYAARRTLGAVLLSRHQFRRAIESATLAVAARPTDAWNYGVLGDAHLELGEYDQAFAAFDRMVRIRPDAAAYARVAYAQELQGQIPAAIRGMRMAAEATGARDPESQAWHFAQIGNLLLQQDDIEGAAREFARADYTFPGHPYAAVGQARVAVARGDLAGGLAMYRNLLRTSPSTDVASASGDLLVRLGDAAAGAAMYARAEALEREGWLVEARQPGNVARLLADQGVRIDEAVRLAEEAAGSRADIFTMDTVAWTYYRAGRHAEALEASRKARRTGTTDARILAHAAIIEKAAIGAE